MYVGVLVVVNVLVTNNSLIHNGIGTVIMQYYRGLDKKEYRYIFVYSDKIIESIKEEIIGNGDSLYYIGCRNRKPISYIRELIKIIKKEKIDIIHVHGNSATITTELVAAKIAGVSVRIAHSHNTKCKHIFFDKLLRPLFYKTYNIGIGCGKAAGTWMFAKHSFRVVKNGISLARYQFDEQKREMLRKQLNSDDKLIVGHIGRFIDTKNHLFMVDVFYELCKLNKKAILLLVGEGPLEASIRAKVEEKGLTDKVIFFGVTDAPEYLYNAMDLFLFPSKYEGVPLTLVEAQASGLPCIISDRISKEVAVTNLVSIVSLDDTYKKWIDALSKEYIDRKQRSMIACEELQKAGFEIQDVIKSIESIYDDSLRRY